MATSEAKDLSASELVRLILFHKPGERSWNKFHDNTLPKAIHNAAKTNPELHRVLYGETKTDGSSPREYSTRLDDALGFMTVGRLVLPAGDCQNTYVNFRMLPYIKTEFEKQHGQGSWEQFKPLADAVWKEYEELVKQVHWSYRI